VKGVDKTFFLWFQASIPIKKTGITLKLLDLMHIVRNLKNTETEEVAVSPYIPANWFTERGAYKKMHLLEAKGLPSFTNWRFLTLTVDPSKFKDNESAYFYIKPRFRFFIRHLKQVFGLKELRYIWKLEFQENGMPHWHMLLDVKKSMCVKTIYDLWKYGAVQVKRCKDTKLPYAFKYITKEAKGLPSFFLSMSRPRVFQSSGIFPSLGKEESASQVVDSSEPKKKPETLGQRLKRYSTSIVISKQTSKGFFPTQIINIKENFNQFFFNTYQLIKDFLRYESPTRVFVPQQYINYLTT